MICPPPSDFTGPRQSVSLGGGQKDKWFWRANRISKALIVAHGGRCVPKVYDWCMSRTNIDIDDELTAEVMRRFGVTTKKAAVDLALRRLVGAPLSRDFLLGLEGVGWEGDLENLRSERPDEFE